jgi:hypothetical protein
MSIFSAISAEHHLKVIQDAIIAATHQVYPKCTDSEKKRVKEALDMVTEYCRMNIGE